MINVVCGIIYKQDLIFIAKRKKDKSLGGKWEFPGGKIRMDETETQALKRELYEELGMEVNVENRVGENIHNYPEFRINLIAYKCKFISATYELTDHVEYKWVTKVDLKNYDLSEADLPFIRMI